MTVLIKGTLALTGKPIWIWVNHIIAMRINQAGGAIIYTSDSQQHALRETPDQVLELISNGLKAAA